MTKHPHTSTRYAKIHAVIINAVPIFAVPITVLTLTAACSSSQIGPTTSASLPPPRPVAIASADTSSPVLQARAPQVQTTSQASASSSSTMPTASQSSPNTPNAQANTPAATQPLSFANTVPTARMTLETGLYRCELEQRVTVRTIAPDRSHLLLNWKGKDYTMHVVKTESGALRYEDKSAGLVWMAIIGKSQLLDSKRGQRLANECNL